MKKSTRICLIALVALMILSLPLAVPSGAMLNESYFAWMDFAWDSEGLLRYFVPTANAEAATETAYSLPIDFTPGMKPNPASYTESGYQDDSITIQLETLEQDGVVWRIARIQIADASQLRTGIAGNKVSSSRTALVSSMAEKYNAVLAISGDYYVNDPAKTTFEYRMGNKVRNKSNRKKDILIIDENGDFHLFVKSDAEKMKEFNASGHAIVNAFTFGPALVIDGNLQTTDDSYGYNPKGKEPRMAIGQMDTLSYVCVLAEGRTNNSEGVTHQELADFMYDLGCLQAFNLDGGNTATMVFNGEYYQTKTVNNERAQSDFIYFATAVDPSTWEK